MIMKCLVKVKDLYLKDFAVRNLAIETNENIIKRIELDSKKYYECESGEEAEFLKFLLTEELAIPEENITIFAIEGYKGELEEITDQTTIDDYIQ